MPLRARLATDLGALDHRQLLRRVAGQEVLFPVRPAATRSLSRFGKQKVGPYLEPVFLDAALQPRSEGTANAQPLVEAAGVTQFPPFVHDGSE